MAVNGKRGMQYACHPSRSVPCCIACRRHALADILMGKLRQLSMQRKLGGAAPVDASLAVQAEG
jgi:hypothetical protein